MRTKNNWMGERKTILVKDDEETLSSKHPHGASKSQDKQSLRSVCGVCCVLSCNKKSKLLIRRKILVTKFSTSVLAIKTNKIIICYSKFFRSSEVTLPSKCQAEL